MLLAQLHFVPTQCQTSKKLQKRPEKYTNRRLFAAWEDPDGRPLLGEDVTK